MEKQIRKMVDVEATKIVLKLDEEHFMQFGNFVSDIKELMKTKNFYGDEFIKSCKIILGREEGKVFHNKRLYREFVKKYKFLLNYFFDNNFDIYWDIFDGPFYEYLKENFEQKEHFLALIEKLCEFKGVSFCFMPNKNFDGEYYFTNDDYKKEGIATDGQMNWLPRESHPRTECVEIDDQRTWVIRIDYSYPVCVKNANYILCYDKYSTSEDAGFWSGKKSASMEFKNLSFDADTLPSYEMLSDFSVELPIDFETVKQKSEGVDRLETIDNASAETKKLLSTLEDLTTRLEYCEDKEEVKAILSKIELIKELYRDIDVLESILYEEVINQGMNKEAIKKILSSRHYSKHCQSC